MEGLANVMDGLDWTKIAGWNDLVSSLARGEHEMVSSVSSLSS